MSEGTTPERVTIAYTKDDVEQMQVDALRFYQQTVVPDLRAQLDAANKRIAEREQDLRDTTKQVEYERIQHATQLAERDARIAELEAKQWDVIAQKFIDLDEHIMATAASVGCDSVASMAREIVKDRARIAELEADLDAISKAFRLHTRPPTTGA